MNIEKEKKLYSRFFFVNDTNIKVKELFFTISYCPFIQFLK